MQDCQKCIHLKVRSKMGFFDKHYSVWVNTHSIYECKITHKIIRMLHRECRKYTNKRQTDLITNQQFGEKLNKSKSSSKGG